MSKALAKILNKKKFFLNVLSQMNTIGEGEEVLEKYFESVVSILKNPSSKRTTDEIYFLQKATTHFDFFKKYREKKRYLDLNIHHRCCRNFTYEYHPKGTVIFKEGDPGDKMYFILKGRLNAYVNKPPEELRKQRAQRAAQRKLVSRENSEPQNSKSEISTHLVMNGAGLTTEVQFPDRLDTKSGEESRTLYSVLDVVDYDENSKGLDLSEFPEVSKFIVDGIFILKYMGTMEATQAFGEVALLRNKPRSATVIAIEDCHLAVLDKQNFEEILMKAEKEKIDQNLEFFNNALGVSINREAVSRLAHIFEKRSVPLEGTIFKEGDDVETLMIIKKGEVMLYKDIEIPRKEVAPAGNINEVIHDFDNQAVIPETRKPKNYTMRYPVQLLPAGTLLGEEMLLGLEKRLFTAVAHSEKVVLFYTTREKFMIFLNGLPEKDFKIPIIQQCKQRYNSRAERLKSSHNSVKSIAKITHELTKPQIKLTHYISRVSSNKIDQITEKIQAKIDAKQQQMMLVNGTLPSQESPKKQHVITSRKRISVRNEDPRKDTLADSFTNIQYIVEQNSQLAENAIPYVEPEETVYQAFGFMQKQKKLKRSSSVEIRERTQLRLRMEKQMEKTPPPNKSMIYGDSYGSKVLKMLSFAKRYHTEMRRSNTPLERPTTKETTEARFETRAGDKGDLQTKESNKTFEAYQFVANQDPNKVPVKGFFTFSDQIKMISRSRSQPLLTRKLSRSSSTRIDGGDSTRHGGDRDKNSFLTSYLGAPLSVRSISREKTPEMSRESLIRPLSGTTKPEPTRVEPTEFIPIKEKDKEEDLNDTKSKVPETQDVEPEAPQESSLDYHVTKIKRTRTNYSADQLKVDLIAKSSSESFFPAQQPKKSDSVALLKMKEAILGPERKIQTYLGPIIRTANLMERKSVQDLFGTISEKAFSESHFESFDRESVLVKKVIFGNVVGAGEKTLKKSKHNLFRFKTKTPVFVSVPVTNPQFLAHTRTRSASTGRLLLK